MLLKLLSVKITLSIFATVYFHGCVTADEQKASEAKGSSQSGMYAEELEHEGESTAGIMLHSGQKCKKTKDRSKKKKTCKDPQKIRK